MLQSLFTGWSQVRSVRLRCGHGTVPAYGFRFGPAFCRERAFLYFSTVLSIEKYGFGFPEHGCFLRFRFCFQSLARWLYSSSSVLAQSCLEHTAPQIFVAFVRQQLISVSSNTGEDSLAIKRSSLTCLVSPTTSLPHCLSLSLCI